MGSACDFILLCAWDGSTKVYYVMIGLLTIVAWLAIAYYLAVEGSTEEVGKLVERRDVWYGPK